MAVGCEAMNSQPPRTAGAGAGRIPDFFLVGHGKSGTTAMYEMLAHHPEVFVGSKEPRYFAAEMHERDMPRPGGTPKTLEEYRAWFAGARPEQKVGDISPWYLWSPGAAQLIADVQPRAKIIAILREPASFLHSLHRQWLQLYVESEIDFRKAMALEDARRDGREVPVNSYWPKALLYSDHVRYVEQLRRYHALFPRENVLVMIYDDYRRDNDAALRSVLRFLGVNETLDVPLRQINPSVQVRAPHVNQLLRTLTVGKGPITRVTKRALMTVTPMRVRQRALHTARKRVVFGEIQPPDPAFMAELRRRFKPEVEALSEYLDRDLVSLWGYDSLD
jgi:hypothetical protein